MALKFLPPRVSVSSSRTCCWQHFVPCFRRGFDRIMFWFFTFLFEYILTANLITWCHLLLQAVAFHTNDKILVQIFQWRDCTSSLCWHPWCPAQIEAALLSSSSLCKCIFWFFSWWVNAFGSCVSKHRTCTLYSRTETGLCASKLSSFSLPLFSLVFSFYLLVALLPLFFSYHNMFDYVWEVGTRAYTQIWMKVMKYE